MASVLAHLGKQKGDPDAEPVQYAPRPGAMQTDTLWGDHKHIYVHSRREDADPEASFAESYVVTKVPVGKGRAAPVRVASSSDSEGSSTLRGRITTFFKSPLGGSNSKSAPEPVRADFPEAPDAVHCHEKPLNEPCSTCPNPAAMEKKTQSVALAEGESGLKTVCGWMCYTKTHTRVGMPPAPCACLHRSAMGACAAAPRTPTRALQLIS